MSTVTNDTKPKTSKSAIGSTTHYLNNDTSPTSNTNKHLSSALNPAEEEKSNKKANMLTRDEYHKHDDQSIPTEELALNTE